MFDKDGDGFASPRKNPTEGFTLPMSGCRGSLEVCEAHFRNVNLIVSHCILKSFWNSGRHDAVKEAISECSPERRQLAQQWAKEDNVAMMLLLGGVQSPYLKFNYVG